MSTDKATPRPWTLRDRSTNPVSTLIEQDISVKEWRWAIDVPRPPFAFGGVTALFVSGEKDAEANARFALKACNLFDELVEACQLISDAPYGVAIGDLEFLNEVLTKAKETP